MYQILQTTPVHCQITDGIIGSESWQLPMTYCTLTYAFKRADQLADENYESCGDDSFCVIDAATGKVIHWYPSRTNSDPDDVMPF